jgi:CGNR zinc finger
MSLSNSNLTVRPRILFCASKHQLADADLWGKIFGEKPPVSVRWTEFTAKFMTIGARERKEFEAGISNEDRDALAALRLLRRAASMPGDSAAADLCEATRRLIHVHDYPKGLNARIVFSHGPKKIMRLYKGLLNENIKQARLAVTTQGGEPSVNILCPDIRTAAFVFAAFRGLEICPGCGKLFAPNPQRAAQHYCSKNCGQRIYQREFRQRQKSKRSKSHPQ